jgi:WD40 repeat protein
MSMQRTVAALVGIALGGWVVSRSIWADEPAPAKAQPAPITAAKAATDPFGDPLPRFVRLRLGTLRFRHGNYIASLSYLPDGKTLVSMGSDQVFRFWEASSGRELYQFGTPVNYNNNPGVAVAVANVVDEIANDSNFAGQRTLSPDGKRVATQENDQTIKLWDPTTGKEVGRLGRPFGPGGSRIFPVFSENSKVLAAVEYDGSAVGVGVIQVFDVTTAKELARLIGPKPAEEGQQVVFQVTSLALSPDGKMVAALSNEAGVANKLRLWQTATGKATEPEDSSNINPINVQGGLGGVAGNAMLFFTPDGKRLGLVVARTDQENGNNVFSIRLWDSATGKKLRDIGGQPEMISTLSFTGDGKTLAMVANNQTVKVHDVQNGKEKYVLPAPANTGVARAHFSPDGRTLAVSAQDGSIHLYDAAKGTPTHELKGPNTLSAIFGNGGIIDFSTDSKTVAVASGSMVRLMDVASGKELHPVRAGHEAEVGALAVSPDGKLIVTAGGDNSVRLWDAASGKQVRQIDGPAADNNQLAAIGFVMSGAPPAFSRDGRLLAIGWGDGNIDVWDMQTGKRAQQLKGHQLPPTSLAFAPNGKALASAGMDGRVLWWDATTGKMVRVIHGKPVGEEGPEIPNVVEVGGATALLSIAMAPDGRTLAVANQDQAGHSIALYELATAQLRRKLRFKAEGAGVAQGLGLIPGLGGNPFGGGGGNFAFTELHFTPDGKGLLWTSGNTIRLVDVAKGKEIRRFGGQEDPIGGMAISPDGKLLAAASGDSTIQLWETASGTVIGQLTGHRGGVNAVAFTADGKELISGGADTTALVWDLPRFQEDTRLAPKPIVDERLGALWKQLGHEKAEQAYEAMRLLEDTPHQAVDLVRSQVKPAAAVDAKRIARLVADLENDRFEVRMRATQFLEKLGEITESALRKRLADNPPLEVRQRVEQLLDKLMGPVTDPDRLRAQRGVEILEHVGTPAAKLALEALAKGAPEARLTQEAKEALARLGR